jgi:hypothetical protein
VCGAEPECYEDDDCNEYDSATCDNFSLIENESYCSVGSCLIDTTTYPCAVFCGAECNSASFHQTNNFYCVHETITRTIEECDEDGCVWNDTLEPDENITICSGTGENDMCYNGSDSCNHCDDGADNDGDGCIDTDWECGDYYDAPNGRDDDCDGLIDEGYGNNVTCIPNINGYTCIIRADGSHIQRSVALVDGKDVQIELPLVLSGANGTHNITIVDFYWQQISSTIKAKQGANITNVTVSGSNLSFEANFSRQLSLLFNVTAPTLIVHYNHTEENFSFINFTVSSPNHLFDVKLNMSVNSSFPEYSVYWLSEDGWVYANALFDVRLVGNVLWVEDFDTSDQDFYANGTDVCTQSWVCTEWSNPSDDCGTRDCVCYCTSGACSGNHAESNQCDEEDNGDGDGDSDGDGDWGDDDECEEYWVCGSWRSCLLGSQTRTCTDSAECGTTEFKPILTRTCQAQTGVDDNESSYSDYDNYTNYTGSGNQTSGTAEKRFLWSWDWFWLPMLIVIIIGGIIAFLYYRRKQEPRKKSAAQPEPQKMITPDPKMHELDDFVETSLKNNVPAKKIIDELISRGWEKKQVEKELKRVETSSELMKQPYLKELDRFIYKCLKSGVSEGKVVNELLKAGWKPELVEQSIKRLRGDSDDAGQESLR